jgi:hypothetical protein
LEVRKKLKDSYIYKKFPGLNKNWTPIQRKSVEIQVGSNPIHIITRVQFPIQSIVGRTIHQTQG